MRLAFISRRSNNRPVVIHRPVLLGMILLILLLQGLGSNTHQVLANASLAPVIKTPTPEIKFSIPASGEPVILQPGNNARLVSPIHLQLITKPGEDGMVRIELLGHDGRLIFRKLMDYSEYKENDLLVEQIIPFEVRDDEAARLQIVLESAKGKPIFITSVELTLLVVRGKETSGDLPVNPRFLIKQPEQGSSISGEALTLTGGLKPINDNPVIVEVLSKDWHTLMSKIVPIHIPTDQTAFTSIDVKLPIKTNTKTPVNLRIRQESKTIINGTVLLWSENITLVP